MLRMRITITKIRVHVPHPSVCTCVVTGYLFDEPTAIAIPRVHRHRILRLRQKWKLATHLTTTSGI
jgi:hypothetical protein